MSALSKEPKHWAKQAVVLWWAILAGLWLTYKVTEQLRGLLVQILLALFLSFAMQPIVTRLSKRGMKRGLATGLTMLTIFIFATLFTTAMGTLIVNQLRQLLEELPNNIASAREWANGRFEWKIDSQELEKQIEEQAKAYAPNLADNLFSFSALILQFLFQILTVSLFAFYFTAEEPSLRRNICSLFPPSRQPEIIRVWELAVAKTGAYISSRFILAIASGAFHWLVFSLLGIPSALALAIWVGIISQFVPVIGTYIAGVLPALIALGHDPSSAVWVVVTILLYQQVENYVIQPRITAQTLDMHPAVAFAAVIAGGSLLGATGAILALPIVATVQSFSSLYIRRHELIDTPQEQENEIPSEE